MEATEFASSTPPATASASPFVTHLMYSSNATASFFNATLAKDIVLYPFRLLYIIDNILFDSLPRFVGRTTGLERLIDRIGAVLTAYWRTQPGAPNVAAGAIAGTAAQAAGRAGVVVDRSWTGLIMDAFQSSTFKSYWGMLHYVFSRWAFTCFVMALVLNRITVYAAPRQRIYLTWTRRLVLRILPILLFAGQIKVLLQAIRCQTSPDFALYRHGDSNAQSFLDWSTEGGIMYNIASRLMWWSDDESACRAVNMMKIGPSTKGRVGSFSLLWPTFLRMCLSHFIESLSCTLQGIAAQTEVGMSVFEHSLAFAEAETMITHALSAEIIAIKATMAATNSSAPPATTATESLQGTIPASGTILAITDAFAAITGPHIMDRVNVPVEVLLVALLSCGNALTSQIITVIGQQKRLRLINTTFWGMSFISIFIWGFFTTSEMVRNDGTSTPKPISGLLHFPTVAIIGFLPHIAILLGVALCACIYVLALTLTAISLGTNPNIQQPSSLSERISIAHDNLQASIQAKGITLKWSEDFYTALLRLGFAALTAASEAVFLNEGRSVEMKQFTWLEEERLDELQASKQAFDLPGNSSFQIAEEYGLPPSQPGSDNTGEAWRSGYAKERKLDKKDGQLQVEGTFVYPNPRTDGVGAMQRTARFYLLFIFLRGIFFTVTGWLAFACGAILDRVGITARPAWLKKIVGKSVKQMILEQKQLRDDAGTKMLEFWMISEDGRLVLPSHDAVDIEPEMRKRLALEDAPNLNATLDEKMYEWWKFGGWFGTADVSGEYQPSINDDEDATSVISMSTNASTEDKDDEYAWESESDGRRTPTQQSTSQSWSFSRGNRSRSATPDVSNDTPLDPANLARLLNPPDSASREEARLLAAHLTSEARGLRIMTRSQYRRLNDGERSRVLLAGRAPMSNSTSTTGSDVKPRPLTAAEEAHVLESLLIARRTQQAKKTQSAAPATSPHHSDEDEASRQTGPPCVVCQSQSRTIIAWPCRCLSLCEDCRVSLAMNNFGNCVTCRRNVGGFVRLYIP